MKPTISRHKLAAAEDIREGRSGFIIVYAAVALSGFLMGLLAGWLIWHHG
jgi:hypothetical protein